MNDGSLAYEFRVIPIALIDEPELIARLGMDDDKLEELRNDIALRGVIQPISVVKSGERYEVVAGHRRRIASGRASLPAMPCLVYPSKEAFLEGVKYAENAFREDMSPADEAYYFSELLEKRCGNDIEQVAALVGRKVSYIDNRLALFSGDPDVFAALRDRKITIGVAHELNKITEAQYRRFYLEHAVRGGTTVAVVVGWVQQWKSMFTGSPAAPIEPTNDAPIAAAPAIDVHRCHVCQTSDPRYIPQMIPVHTHCLIAVLDKLLAAYHGEQA